jgi:hypothetical protein
MVTTIRVAMGDRYTGTYVMKDQATQVIDLTAATPNGVVLYQYDAATGYLIASTACVITTPTSGLVTYTLGDICTASRNMYVLVFKVTTPTNEVTCPAGQEQGLWVY